MMVFVRHAETLMVLRESRLREGRMMMAERVLVLRTSRQAGRPRAQQHVRKVARY